MTSVLDAPAVSGEVRGCQFPLIRRVPDYAQSSGPEVTELAARAGLFLDPWESLALEDFLGEDGHGNWTSTENGLVAPRQNGKGAIVEAPVLVLGPGGREIRRSVAPRLRFLARSRVSGKGFTGRVVILDEAFELAAAAMRALMPTMSAQALFNPQLWYTSTPPDQEQDKNARVLSGVRRRALDGAHRLAWLEWAADVSHLAGMGDAEAERERIRMRRDPAVLARANPGLGILIDPASTE